MNWTKPDFEEVSLNMEVTAYVNTDDQELQPPPKLQQTPETAQR